METPTSASPAVATGSVPAAAAEIIRTGHRQRPPPVFIAGCGRSGTTYLKTLMDAHPDVFIPTESLFIVDYLSHGACLPLALLRRLFFSEPQLRAWYAGNALRASCGAELVERVHQHAAAAAGARIWGQKTPRFVCHMSLIDAAFPDARWILMHRDPRAVVSSMLRSRRHTYSVRRACRRWNRDNAALLAGCEGRDGRVLVIAYESLVARPAATLAQIWAFLCLPDIPLERLLESAEVRPLAGSGFTVNSVRDGVHSDPAKTCAWRQHLRAAQQAYIEDACSELMQRLGYTPEAAETPAPMLLDDVVNAARDIGILWEYLRHWPAYLLHTALRRGVMTVACGLHASGWSAER